MPGADNKAVRSFKDIAHDGKDDLTKYEGWYSTEVIKYLVHSQSRKQPCVRYIFSSNNYLNEFTNLRRFRNLINLPVFFISFTPGKFVTSHFVFGVLFKEELIIINPQGKTDQVDFYETLVEIKKNTKYNEGIKKIYISEIVIQRDLNKGGVNLCGPICVELMKHLLDMEIFEISKILTDTKLIKKVIPKKVEDKEVIHEEISLEYSLVDIQTILPTSLRIYLQLQTSEYQEAIVTLRKSHLKVLEQTTINLTLEEQDRFWDGCLKADEQELMELLLFKDIATNALVKHEGFTRLQKNLIAPVLQLNKLPNMNNTQVVSAPSNPSRFTSSKPSNDKEKNDKLVQIFIPANGNCLFTSVFIGYLLAVIDNEENFSQRLKILVGDNIGFQELRDYLISNYKLVTKFNENSFKVYILKFRKNLRLDNGLWGGAEEIQILANRLNITIQELLENPDKNSSQLYIESNKTVPEDSAKALEFKETIYLLQTTANTGEILQSADDAQAAIVKMQSLASAQQNQHYRLLIGKAVLANLNLPQSKTNKQKNTKPSTNEITSANLTISNEKMVANDVNRLISIKLLIVEALKDNQKVLMNLKRIGELINLLSWKEDKSFANLVRNKHGYRNRADQNKLNRDPNSVKLNFEALAHLKELSADEKHKFLLAENISLTLESLVQLEHKIDFILSGELKLLSAEQTSNILNLKELTLNPSNSNQSNFLEIVSAFYHDLQCINNLLALTQKFCSKQYIELDLVQKIDRYQLGYLFTQIGETAKEISDFFKPENFEQADKNLTRFLFTKLGHYRQEIKDFPWIVYGHEIERLLQMKIKLSSVANGLIDFLFAVKQVLEGFLNAQKIFSEYPTINSVSSGKPTSNFEKTCLERIKIITQALIQGTTNLKKRQETLETQISTTEELLIDKKSEREEKNKEKDGATKKSKNVVSSDKKYDQLIECLIGTLYKTNVAKQFVGFLKNLTDEDLAKFLSDPAAELIKFHRKNIASTSSKDNGRKNSDKIAAFQGIFLKYQKQLCAHIRNYNEHVESLQSEQKKLIKIDETTYAGLFDLFNEEEAQDPKLLQLEDSIKDLTLSIEKNSKILESLKADLRSTNEEREKLLDEVKKITKDEVGKSNAEKKRKKLLPHEAILLSMMTESEFLQVLDSKVQHAMASGDEELYQKLLAAEKMSFGFYGQYYKVLKEDHVDKLTPNLLSVSIFSDDCFEVMLIRHKHISHNTHAADTDNMVQEAIKKKITPWNNEFRYMMRLSLEEREHDESEISEIMPVDDRLSIEFEEFSPEDKKLFFVYTKILVLNRFLKSDEALAVYNSIVGLINGNANPELATEIHWQASLSYRNLNQFEQCVAVLKKVIEFSQKISNEAIRGYKLNGARADMGIALVQLDRFQEAKVYLKEVTLNAGFAHDSQIISANLLLGSIEGALGNDLLAKSYLELTFVKYFEKIMNFNKASALSLLSRLASIYLDDLDHIAARDCLQFAERILHENFHEFIRGSGQQALYYKVVLQDTLAKFKMLEFVSKEEQDSDVDLEKIHRDLLAEKDGQAVFPYFSDKAYGTVPLCQVIILKGEDDDFASSFLRNTFVKEEYKAAITLEIIAENILNIKRQIILFQIDKQIYENHDEGKDLEYGNKLNEMVEKISFNLGFLAFKFFLDKDFIQAKELMKKSILYRWLVDFLEYDFECVFSEIAVDLAQITNSNEFAIEDVFLSPRLLAWAENSDIQDEEIKLYANKRLTDPDFKQLMVQREDSIFKKYNNAINDEELRRELISRYEIQLMACFQQQTGGVIWQFKVDEETGLLTQRLAAPNEKGAISVKEKNSPFKPKFFSGGQESDSPTNHMFKDIFSKSASEKKAAAPKVELDGKAKRAQVQGGFSPETEKMFKGMFSKPDTKEKAADAKKEAATSKVEPDSKTKGAQTQEGFSPETEQLFKGMFSRGIP